MNADTSTISGVLEYTLTYKIAVVEDLKSK